MHESPGFHPQAWWHTVYNLSTWEVEERGSKVEGQLEIYDFLSKTKNKHTKEQAITNRYGVASTQRPRVGKWRMPESSGPAWVRGDHRSKHRAAWSWHKLVIPAFLIKAGRSEAQHHHYPRHHKKTDASLDYRKQNQPTNQTKPRTSELFPRAFQLSNVPPPPRSRQDVCIQSTLESSISHHWRSRLNLTVT